MSKSDIFGILKIADRPCTCSFVIGDFYDSLGDHGWISEFAVDSRYQRRGIGTALLKAAERKLKGCKIIWMINVKGANATKLYEKKGFRINKKYEVRQKRQIGKSY